MHSNTRSHTPILGVSWSAATVTLTILLTFLFLIILFLFLIIVAQPAQAQTSVPPTARQAATMPQFASRLVHPAQRSANASRVLRPTPTLASHRSSSGACSQNRPQAPSQPHWLPDDNGILYSNGPINGTTDAWTINSGFVVSDTFALAGSGDQVTGFTFGAWLFPGDVLQTVEISISSAEFGGTIYNDQVVSFTQSGCSGNQYGFNVCTESGTLATVNLPAQGTYWVNLQNAVVNDGDPVYWDENSGPSAASENSVGTIPSEAFTVLGSTTTTSCYFDCPPECVHDEGNFNVIYNFSSSEQQPTPGLAIDPEGRLYGATGSGGNNGEGLAYELASHWGSWVFTPLYSFLGGANGQDPLPGTFGQANVLYGTADGGLQTCGSSGNEYCGVVYRLRPSPVAWRTALPGWNETVIYQFTGSPDGSQPNGNLVFDKLGNLYGTTSTGGAYGFGAIYELAPSEGGGTEQVIYSFTGGADGASPTSLLLGQDGNLYGTTSGGGGGGGVIFQLVPSGGSWAETVIASFGSCAAPYSCSQLLIRESSGSFYGISTYPYYSCQTFPPYSCFWDTFGTIFVMSPSGGGWQLTTIDDTRIDDWGVYGCQDYCYDVIRDLTIDAAGNLYATKGQDWADCVGDHYSGEVYEPAYERSLVSFAGDNFLDVEVDASGKLYGTTGACGQGQSIGTVWQLSP